MTRKHGLARHHESNWMEQSPVEPRAEHSGYFPNTEYLGKDEMRVIILGSGMPNARKSQASASILVELGNGDKFIFDIGSESVQNLGALEIPYDWLDKVFITHLHQDHFADLLALWIGGWTGGRHWINDATMAARHNLALALLQGSGPYGNKLDHGPWPKSMGARRRNLPRSSCWTCSSRVTWIPMFVTPC